MHALVPDVVIAMRTRQTRADGGVGIVFPRVRAQGPRHTQATRRIGGEIVHPHRFLRAHHLAAVLAATAGQHSTPSTPTSAAFAIITPATTIGFGIDATAAEIVAPDHPGFHGFDEGLEVRNAGGEEGKEDDDFGAEHGAPNVRSHIAVVGGEVVLQVEDLGSSAPDDPKEGTRVSDRTVNIVGEPVCLTILGMRNKQ